MSWSVGEFTATSVEAAKAECERQVGNVAEREKVLALLNAALDHCDIYPGLYLYVRAFGHGGAPGGGNVLIEIKPAQPPKS